MTSGDLEADFVADAQRDVALDVVLGVWQEEALATVLVADATVLARARHQLGRHRARHALLAQHLSFNIRALAHLPISRGWYSELKTGSIFNTFNRYPVFQDRYGHV